MGHADSDDAFFDELAKEASSDSNSDANDFASHRAGSHSTPVDSSEVVVTTVDLRCDYRIIGPVYFQISNKGLFSNAFDVLAKQYKAKFSRVGSKPPKKTDWGFLYGEWSVGQNDFDLAFYIAVEELRKRAARIGGNGIVGLRQDIDLDTNGFSNFYLQAYGTAVSTSLEVQ